MLNGIVLGVFCLVMFITRYPFAGEGLHVVDASWALFFLLGRLQLSVLFKIIGFVILAFFGWLIDIAAIKGAVVSSYCMTPAYLGMPVAYGVLAWFGFLSQQLDVHRKLAFIGLVFLSGLAASLAFIITNGFFYAGSGYFTEMALTTYVQSVMGYWPHYVLVLQMYVVIWFLLNQIFPLERRLASEFARQQVAV